MVVRNSDSCRHISSTLSNAATNGHEESVRLILQKSSELEKTRALPFAASEGHTAIVRLLLNKVTGPIPSLVIGLVTKGTPGCFTAIL